MKTQMKTWVAGVCGSVLLGITLPAVADNVPLSHQASPEVYKVLAEKDEMRVVLATWKPGQIDKFHSHPMLAAYSITDCNARITKSDGTVKEVNNKAGEARINPPVKSHTFENIGKTVCQTLLVERKK
jgi:quercetin dioxygenase-like cupin family protein